MTHTHPSTLICVSTYLRPAGLERLIRSVLPQIQSTNSLLVVIDNDPEGGAQQLVNRFATGVAYEHEPIPGIAATRNRALDVAAARGVDRLVFVDDDEWMAPDWHENMQSRANNSPCGVIAGPVITVYEDHLPPWIQRYGFLDRTQLPDGAHPSSAATHNTLLKMDAWRQAGSPRFDHSFSTTGGSDTDFFSRLTARHVQIEYSRAPKAYEDIPPERANLRWITRRGIRTGMVRARLDLRHRGRLRVAASGMARVLKGVPMTLWSLLFIHKRVSDRYAVALRGLGMLATATTRLKIEEYGR